MPEANRYTTTEFLASVRRKGHIPASQTPFLDVDLLALADDEIATALVSQIRTAREGYYKTYVVAEINGDNVYDIPSRAISAALEDVWIVNGTEVFPVGRSETNEQFSTVSSPTGYWSYEILDNQIKILPVITAGEIWLWHMRMPNKLVPTTAAAQVTAIDQHNAILTFNALPSTFLLGSSYDCIADQPHFNWRFVDKTPTAIDATTLTFTSLPLNQYGNSLISIGDWIALSGQSPIPQVPTSFSPLLVQRVVCKYYEIQGYQDKLATALKSLDKMEKAVFELINPRIGSEPKRIVPDSNVIGGYRRWRAWRAT